MQELNKQHGTPTAKPPTNKPQTIDNVTHVPPSTSANPTTKNFAVDPSVQFGSYSAAPSRSTAPPTSQYQQYPYITFPVYN
jgi:hypothetical protein